MENITSRKERRKKGKVEENKNLEKEKVEKDKNLEKEKVEKESLEKDESKDLEKENAEMFRKNDKWPEYVWLKGTSYESAGAKRKRNMNMNIQIPVFDLHIGNGQKLLDNAELNIQYGKRYGLIGRNGIGKSVLLRAISSREGPFSNIPDWYTILHVEQEIIGDDRSPLEVLLASDRERLWLLEEAKRLENNNNIDENFEDENEYDLADIYERLREIEAHKAESRAASILSGLQFGDYEMRNKPSKEYSGGWRMRISLARALFMTPELLILDEPTNHLDLHASIWLEKYLSDYKKTLLLVSHDESILDECVDNIIYFFNSKLYYYKGNYSSFLKIKAQNDSSKLKKQKAQDFKIKKIQKDTGGKSKAKKKQEVEKIQKDRVEIVMDEKVPRFDFPDIGAKEKTIVSILKFDDVSYGYAPEIPVVKDLCFGIYMGSRIALVGANGTGKSTIMKLMSGELLPDTGSVEVGKHLRVVKYDQHAEEKLDLNKTCVEWIQENDESSGNEEECRKILGRFGLHGKTPLQKIGTLSGGQRARLVFATLALRKPHLMLLDEPTNHLDLFTIQALIEGLNNYGGALVIISHNQKILSKCCNQTWVVNNNMITKYQGTFEEYKKSIL